MASHCQEGLYSTVQEADQALSVFEAWQAEIKRDHDKSPFHHGKAWRLGLHIILTYDEVYETAAYGYLDERILVSANY